MLEINTEDSGLDLKLIEVNERECHGALQALDQTLDLLYCCSVCPYCCWVLQTLPDAKQPITPLPGEVWWGQNRTAEPERCRWNLLYARVWGSICISLVCPLFSPFFHNFLAIRKKTQNKYKTKPCEISSTGRTHPSSEGKTFLQVWPQVLKQKCRAVRKLKKAVTRCCGLKYLAAKAACEAGSQ